VNPAAQGSAALAPRLVTPQSIPRSEAPDGQDLLPPGSGPASVDQVRSSPDAAWRLEVLERVRKRRQVRTHALPLFVDGQTPSSGQSQATRPVEPPPPLAAAPLDEAIVEGLVESVDALDPRPAAPAPDYLAILEKGVPSGVSPDPFDLPLRPADIESGAGPSRVELPSQSLVERPRPTLVSGLSGPRSLVADLPLVEPTRVEPPPAELPPRLAPSAISSRAASMSDRLQAAFIDVGLWSAMCVTAFYFASRIARTSVLGLAPSWPGLLLFATVIAAAYVLFFGGLSGATPGKIACGIQVKRYDGTPLGPLASLGRGSLGLLSVVFLGLGIWPAFWDRDRRTLHDRATNSRVTIA
jgi:uncharacterized RDD family membrane protein YckC